MKQNWNFQRGGVVQTKKPSVGGVWIFSGTTQLMVNLEPGADLQKFFCATLCLDLLATHKC